MPVTVSSKRKHPSPEADNNETDDSSSPSTPEPNTKRKRSAPKNATDRPWGRKGAHAALLALEGGAPLEMPPKDTRNLKLRGTVSAATGFWRGYRGDMKKLGKLQRRLERKQARKARREADELAAAKVHAKEARARVRAEKAAERDANREKARQEKQAAREGVRAAREAERAIREEHKAARLVEREAKKALKATSVKPVRKARESTVKKVVAKRAPRQVAREESEEYDADSEDVEELEDEAVKPPLKCHLLDAPIEIREMIYEHLLTTDTPICLIEGWAKLWKGGKGRGLGLHTAIMRTHSWIADECIRVLYGGNTFEYVLRDVAPIKLPGDGDGTTTDSAIIVPNEDDFDLIASDNDDDDDDDDSEYDFDEDEMDEDDEDDAADQPNRRTSTAPGTLARQASNPNVAIDIAKFGQHFRRITIVTEKNRTEPGYLHSMADAIDAFRDLSPFRARIHTISIVVNPSREGDTITFLDFFEPEGRVVQSLRGLPCQFIRLVVNTDSSARKERLPHEIKLDMRSLDAGADDEVRQQRRQTKLVKRHQILRTLPQLIKNAWLAGADPDPEEDAAEEEEE
ncbi:hypothetical protein ACHAQA_004919 [Verticillium albo-atrum]